MPHFAQSCHICHIFAFHFWTAQWPPFMRLMNFDEGHAFQGIGRSNKQRCVVFLSQRKQTVLMCRAYLSVKYLIKGGCNSIKSPNYTHWAEAWPLNEMAIGRGKVSLQRLLANDPSSELFAPLALPLRYLHCGSFPSQSIQQLEYSFPNEESVFHLNNWTY